VTQPADPPPAIQLFNSQGPMARSVADLRTAFGVLVRPSTRDPWQVPLDARWGETSDRLRVAVVRDPVGLGVHPEVGAGVDRAAQALRDAGHRVEDAEPPGIGEAAAGWGALISADIAVLLPQMESLAGDGARRFLAIAGAALPAPDAALVGSTMVARHRLLREWAAFQETYDVVLGPIATVPPFPAGADFDEAGAGTFLAGMRLVLAVNFLGLPSVAVPAGLGHGMPQGVQLIGRRFGEIACLEAAAAVEQA
jgi:amidase